MTQHIVELDGATSWSRDKVERVLAAILEAGVPVPALDITGELSSDVIDWIQAAMLRHELAMQRPSQ